MKRFTGSVLIFGLIAAYMISCEKDDICAQTTPTTPNMVVKFYSNDNRGSEKTVENLKFFVEGNQDTISVGATDSTHVPLPVNATTVKWGFKRSYRLENGQKVEPIDYLEFKYTTREEYVSRACGFKTLFTMEPNQPAGTNPVLTHGNSSFIWIRDAQILNPEIDNEDEVHLNIYF